MNQATCLTLLLSLFLSLGGGKHLLIKTIDTMEDKDPETVKENGEDYGNDKVDVRGGKVRSVSSINPPATPGAPALPPPTRTTRPTRTTKTRRTTKSDTYYCDWVWC